MTRSKAVGDRLRAGCLVAATASSLLVALAGCVSNPSQDSQAVASEVVTPSDEPETRRRARIRLELASGYFAEGKTDVALDEVKQALAADPTFSDAYNMRGLIYMRLGDNRGAEASFRRALELNPRDADAAHNYGWLQCQTGRYSESFHSFQQAMANPVYPGKSKTLMALGICQARAGMKPEAEKSLTRSYELDPGNPVTGYNLAQLLYERGDYLHAQFYIRRLNNSELANAESLWLGIKVEQRMNDQVAMQQLGDQLRRRFPQSKQRQSLDRRAFDE